MWPRPAAVIDSWVPKYEDILARGSAHGPFDMHRSCYMLRLSTQLAYRDSVVDSNAA